MWQCEMCGASMSAVEAAQATKDGWHERAFSVTHCSGTVVEIVTLAPQNAEAEKLKPITWREWF